MSYKSKKVLFFKNKKIISLGGYVTPTLVKIMSKRICKNEVLIGRLMEYTIVVSFVLSIIFFLK